MSPPLSMKQHWFAPHTAYSMAKYGMSMCTLAMPASSKSTASPSTACGAHRHRHRRAADDSGVDLNLCRKPEILADAAYLIFTTPGANSGNFYIDDALLAAHGVKDLEQYSVKPGTKHFIPISS